MNEFLKELNDMDDINSRFQSQMQQKENETFLKFSPGQDVQLGQVESIGSFMPEISSQSYQRPTDHPYEP